MRRHEFSHPIFEAVSSPRRLQELYPLLQTDKTFAVQQACNPIWPSATAGISRRGPRSLATHVLQRAERCMAQVHHAEKPLQVRSSSELFSRPTPMTFKGG